METLTHKNADVIMKDEGEFMQLTFQSKKAKEFAYEQIPAKYLETDKSDLKLNIQNNTENVNHMIALLVSHNLSSFQF